MITNSVEASARSTAGREGDARALFASGIMPDRGHGSLAAIEASLLPPPRPAPIRGSRESNLHNKLCRAFKDTQDRMSIPQGNGALAFAKGLAADLTSGKLRGKIPHEPRDATDPGSLLTIAIEQFADALNGQDVPKDAVDAVRLRTLLAWLDGYCQLNPLNRDIRQHSLHGLRALVAQLVAYCA